MIPRGTKLQALFNTQLHSWKDLCKPSTTLEKGSLVEVVECPAHGILIIRTQDGRCHRASWRDFRVVRAGASR